jgi:hypothetical protein
MDEYAVYLARIGNQKNRVARPAQIVRRVRRKLNRWRRGHDMPDVGVAYHLQLSFPYCHTPPVQPPYDLRSAIPGF